MPTIPGAGISVEVDARVTRQASYSAGPVVHLGPPGATGPQGPVGPPGAGGAGEDYTGIDVSGALDSTAALQALLKPTRTTRVLDTFWGATRYVVDLPKHAQIRITSQLEIDESIILRMNGSRIFCKTDSGLVDMLVIRDSAPGTLIEGGDFIYAISSNQLEDNDLTAIKVECFNFQFRDITISGAGYGLVLDTEDEAYNLNCAFIENVWILGSRRVAFKILGVDCSAAAIVALRTLGTENHFESTNGAGAAIGIYEATANGSTYLACHVEVSNEGLVIQPRSGVCPSTFVGLYIEDSDGAYWRASPDSPFSNFSSNTCIVGGGLSRLNESRGDRVGGSNSRLTFRSQKAARMSGLPTLTFTNAGGSDTITRSAGPGGGTAGSWVADGFQVGMTMSAPSGTVSNNFATGVIAGVTATVLTFGASTTLTDEIITATALVSITATDTPYEVYIPYSDAGAAIMLRAEDSVNSEFLLQLDTATAGTERWQWRHFFNQSINLSGLEAIDLGGSWEVNPLSGADKHQDLAGAGAWDAKSNTVYVGGSGARAITLPNAPQVNWEVLVVDDAGSAGAGTITVTGVGTVNGGDTITSNYGNLRLRYRGSGNWVRV